MNYATVENVATELGLQETELTQVQKDQIQAWIGATQRKIRNRLGSLEHLDEDDLRDVIAAVVARRFDNPRGKQRERIDDYDYSLDRDVAKGTLHLTDEEWEQLTPALNDSPVGQVRLQANPGYGPVARSARDHPARGWW